MSLNTSSFNVTFNAGETNTVGLIADPHAIFQQFALTLTDGTGANKAQKLATQSLSVTTGGTTIDLTACAGGPANAAINFTKLRALMILNNDATTVNLIVGNAASNQWTGLVSATTTTITLGPGGCLAVFRPDSTGMAVSGSSKNILLAASATTCSVSFLAVGEGA